jgi:hypothetical protein
MRGWLQGHGVTIARGARTALVTIPQLLADADAPIPMRLRAVLARLLEEVHALERDLATLDRELGLPTAHSAGRLRGRLWRWGACSAADRASIRLGSNRKDRTLHALC